MTAESGYQEIAPPPALAEDVACFWAANPALEERSQQAQRVLPDGCADIIFDLATGSAKVVGTMTKAIVVPEDGHPMLAVRFRPGAAGNYFRLPIHEITDDSVPLREFWHDGCNLAQRLSTTGLNSSRLTLQVLAQELLQRRQRLNHGTKSQSQQFLTCSIVRALSKQNEDISVADLARGLAVSRQHLTRQFKQRVGISPKQFQRVIRMQRLVNTVWRPQGDRANTADIQWAGLALRCGYFDQAHMIADFRELCGITPAAYFGR